jgi:hypothetical protein
LFDEFVFRLIGYFLSCAFVYRALIDMGTWGMALIAHATNLYPDQINSFSKLIYKFIWATPVCFILCTGWRMLVMRLVQGCLNYSVTGRRFNTCLFAWLYNDHYKIKYCNNFDAPFLQIIFYILQK